MRRFREAFFGWQWIWFGGPMEQRAWRRKRWQTIDGTNSMVTIRGCHW